MSAPPPLPPTAHAESLLEELRALDTPELLALCLRFRRAPARLTTYLAILRGRSGTRAQFAACLVCYDLARLGVDTAQRDFLALTPTMLELAKDQKLVSGLLAGDPYLEAIWAECNKVLSTLEPADALGAAPQTTTEEFVGELELLGDEDLSPDVLQAPPPPPAAADPARVVFLGQVNKQFDLEAEALLSGPPGVRERATSRDELATLEQLLVRAGSLSDRVPVARGLAAIGNLFVASLMRRQTLFGRPNQQRQTVIREGLRRLDGDPQALAEAAALFELQGPPTIARFEKVLELLLDYLAFCGQDRRDPKAAATVDAYVAANRQPRTFPKRK